MADVLRSRRSIKPPPNFNSRKTQAKLFVVVVACMAIIYGVTEFTGLNRTATEPSVNESNEKIDPRLERLPDERPATSPDVFTIRDPFRGTLDQAEQSSDGLSRALADGWAALYQQMSASERGLIAKAFKSASLHKTLDEEDAESWQALLSHGDEFWKGYRENAAKGLAVEGNTLTNDELSAWLAVLGKVGEEWIADRDVLASLASDKLSEVTATRDARLARLQQRWDQLSLAAIKDDTVHRPAETDAWFRLCDILNTTSQSDLDRQAAESVSHVQLFKQSPEYRGKLVRIKGRVVQAIRFKPAKNVYGIKEQYLLWVKPEGSTEAPLVVYALELPPGFPSLDNPNAKGDYTKLREDVEVTGYFFKRYAYLAHDGINTAPLLLTKAPRWFPSVDIGARATELPSAWTFASWVLGSALLATVLAVVAYVRSSQISPAIESMQSSPAAQRELRASIDQAVAGPTVSEQLRLLEERDRQDDSRKQS